MNAILDGVPYTIERIGSWTTVRRSEVIGAIAELTVGSPVTFTADLPTISYDETEEGSPPYFTVRHVKTSVRSAGSLSVTVDFASAEVVAIRPDPNAETTVEEEHPSGPSGGD